MKKQAIVSFALVVFFLFTVVPTCARARANANFAGSGLNESASLRYAVPSQQSNIAVGQAPLKPYVAFMHAAVQDGNSVGLDSPPPANYDEQLGLTFTQNFSSLVYNVTAVEQNDTYGYGPAYLLNGLTDKGYWYQAGLSFDWPYTSGGYTAGFNFNYEVFNNRGKSIFPVSGGGGLDSFNGTVNDGDNVLLNLYFSSGNVVMYAYDWNTSASAEETYNAMGASLFEGQTSTYVATNGFFTGLMTEWYHPNPYYGGEAQVVYDDANLALSSGWLWADEGVPSNGTILFEGSQYNSFSSNATQLQYFTTNGAVEAASGYQFMTGGTLPLSVSISPSSAMMDVGQQRLFTSNVTGGTSPYTYQWYLNGSAILDATDFTLNFTPSSIGSYNVYVNVTDNTGLIAESNIAFVTVNPSLSVNVSPTSVVMDVGDSQLFTSSVTGGAGPYSYQWYLAKVLVSDATNTTWTFTPTSAGSYTVYVEVTDSVGAQATYNTVNVTVNTHDVAVTNVTTSKTVVGQGYGLNVTVTAADLGDYSETFTVTVYANTTSIASQNVTLSSGNSTDITFTWNTTNFAYGNYTISAYAWPVPGETNMANNNFTGGNVTVTIPGDINGDGTVDIYDAIILSAAYGSTPGSKNWNPNADINGDGIVDIYDAIILASAYGSTPGSPNWNANADLNGDGVVDIYDAIIQSAHFGQSIP